MKSQSIFTVLVAMLAFFIADAQKTTPDVSIEVGSAVNSLQLTDAGTVVLNTNDGLVGVFHESDKPVFQFTEYGKLKEEEYYMMPNSPYMVISKGGFAGFSSKKAVLNYFTGLVVFESTRDDWKQVYTETILLPDNKLVISGLQKSGSLAENNTPKIAVYDLETGKLDFSFFMFTPGKVVSGNFSVTGNASIWNDMILIPTSKGLYAKTFAGETVWENDVKNLKDIVVSEQAIYGFEATANGTNAKIYKMDTTGKESWEKPVKVKGSISNFQITSKGIAVVSDKEGGSSAISLKKAESEIAFFSAETGEDLWEKAPKTKGYVQHFYEVEGGFLFGIYEGGINQISYDGNTMFKKPLKTGENIITMALSPQGLIYITSEDANIINLSTGESVWKNPLKFKKATTVVSTYDQNNQRYLVATDNELYSIDENTGDYKEISNWKLDEKEVPNHIEVRNNNIYLSSSQNMLLLDKDGKQLYHEYHKSPGISTFGKIALGTLAVATTTMSVAMSAKAGANKTGIGSTNDLSNYNETGKDAKRAADMFSSIGTASFSAMAKRFRASVATKDSHVLLTKTGNGVGLLKLAKDSGKVEKELTTDDKKPEYIIDEVDQVLYYVSDKKTISIFNI